MLKGLEGLSSGGVPLFLFSLVFNYGLALSDHHWSLYQYCLLSITLSILYKIRHILLRSGASQSPIFSVALLIAP